MKRPRAGIRSVAGAPRVRGQPTVLLVAQIATVAAQIARILARLAAIPGRVALIALQLARVLPELVAGRHDPGTVAGGMLLRDHMAVVPELMAVVDDLTVIGAHVATVGPHFMAVLPDVVARPPPQTPFVVRRAGVRPGAAYARP